MKLKLIAAAVALVASGSSFAAISGPDDGVAGFAAVATEMFLTVWQASGTGTGSVNRSFTYDTGVSVADMQMNKGVNLFIDQTISGSPEWASFLAAGTSMAFQYNLAGGDRIDVTRNVLLQTYAGPNDATLATSIAPKTNLGLANALDAMQQYVGANNATGTHGTVANGSSFNTSGDEYFMTNNSNNWRNTTGLNSVAIGSKAMFGQMLQSDDFPGNSVKNTIYAGQMLLSKQGSDYRLQYLAVAVPEASGYAMALAGIGFVGFVARRRKSA